MVGFLVRITIESVHAVLVRGARGPKVAYAPFAEYCGGVAGFFQGFRERIGFRSDGPVSLEVPPVFAGIHAFQVLNVAVVRVFSGQQDVAGGGADRSAGVELYPSLAFGSQFVEIQGLDFLLHVAPHFRPAQIVCVNEHDIGAFRSGRMDGEKEYAR